MNPFASIFEAGDEHQLELDDMLVNSLWSEEQAAADNDNDDDDNESFDFAAFDVAPSPRAEAGESLSIVDVGNDWCLRQNNSVQMRRKIPAAGFTEWVGANMSLLLVRNKHVMQRSDLAEAVRVQWKNVDANTQALFARLHQRQARAKHHNRANSTNLCK
jgi:hypothetical protein